MHPRQRTTRVAWTVALALCACGQGNRGAADTLGPVPPATAPTSTGPPLAAGAWLEPGTFQTRTVVRDDDFLQTTNVPASWQSDIADQYTASFYVPHARVPISLDLMMVFGPLGTNTQVLGSWASIADARGLLVMAVDGYKSTDEGEARSHEYYYCALKAVSDLKHDAILGRDAPFLLAGMSGGAKMAMMIGEYGGTDVFRGVIAAGCNQDLATYGQQMFDNPSALALPFIIVNASDDDVVGGATPNVVASMQSSGFTSVSTMTYTGGHVMPPLPVLEQAVDSLLPR